MINSNYSKKTFKIVFILKSFMLTFIENKGLHMNLFRKVIFLLTILFKGNTFLFGQPIYNDCFQAVELCPNTSFSFNNIDANKTVCPNCEDDFIFCFTSNNSIWLKFTTNALGGDVQVDFSNLIFETGIGQDNELQASIFSPVTPCQGNNYVQIGNCVTNATGNFSLNALALTPNTEYYIVINGDKTGVGITKAAECTFDLIISGPGINRTNPTINIAAASQLICKNEVVFFSSQVFNCPDSTEYLWYINGVLAATTIDHTFQTSALDSGDVVSVSNTCFTLCTQTISATSSPFIIHSFTVYAGQDVEISSGQSIQLQGTTNATSYSWSPSLLVSNPNVLNPIAVPTETTIYTLSATKNNCTLFDDVTVTFTQELTIPTTFSPNNDEINDVWEIVGIEKFPNNFLRIYDRWGQEVFQKTGYTYAKAWNGEIHNKELASGVYFYVLELKDEKKQIKKGSVTVIR